MSLFTLCLTPLAVHIFAGVPEPTVLIGPKPQWHDRICHLNPTSIFWRYYAITIRRSSTKRWGPADMAAANAVFWTGEVSKWDGSKEIMIMIESRKLCTRLPSGSRIPLMSASAMKTLLVTMQGIQAMYGLLKGLKLGGYALKVALPNIFLPLALAGLYRLPASLWLTEEYGYATIDSKDATIESGDASLPENLGFADTSEPLCSQKNWPVIVVKPNIFLPLALAGLYRLPASPWLTEEHGYATIDSEDATTDSGDASLPEKLEFADTSEPLYSLRNWLVIAVKIFFLGTIAVLCALSIYYFKPNPRITSGTASTLTINLFYTIFLFVTLVTAILYTVRGQSNTTIIPCISSTWYRIYTYFLFLFALWLLIASALETRITPCGETTYPAKLGLDHFMC
jgi:hypothetical protein